MATSDGNTWNAAGGRQDFGAIAAASAESRSEFRANFIFGLFVLGLIGVTFLEKIGFLSGSGGVLPVAVPIVVAGVLAGLLMLKPVYDPIRIGLYAAAMVLAGLSSVFLSPVYSASSFILFALLYLPMAVSFEVTEETYRRCMNAFVTVMLFFCAVVALEHVIQFVIGPKAWPNLNKMIAPQWLIPEYNYLQPIVWRFPYHKPNALVFLEVSILSQYIALALAVELALFQRPLRMGILACGLLATFAGTGVLLMALTLPVLLGRLRIRQMVMVIAALTVISWIAFRIGWFDIASARMDEYKHNGSSANMRFIEPFDRLLAFLGDGNPLFSGIGAGQIEKGGNFQWWPFTKASIEYGLIPGLVFYGFFLYALFKDTAYRSIAFTLAVWYSFEGALLTAINPLTCVLLSTMFLVRREGKRPSFREGLAGGLLEKLAPRPVPAAKAQTPAAERPMPAAKSPARDTMPPPLPAAEAQGTAAAITVPGTAGRLIYAIGDVHGRADLLAPLIERIRDDAARHPPPDGTRPMIVFLGDYIDRGRRSREVIDQILALREQPGIEVRALLGNHEEAMLAYLDGASSGISFGRYGGRETLRSYGIEPPLETDGKEGWEALRGPFRDAVPAAHVAFLRELELTIVTGDCLFVHAGLRAGVPLDRQSRRDMLYIREEFFREPVDCGKFIVHGHTPGEAVFGAPGRLCLDTGAYASGILTAGRFDGGEPRILQVGTGSTGSDA